MKIKIISGGNGMTTRVFNRDGVEIKGAITRIDIEPILPGQLVTAHLTFEDVELEIEADDTEDEDRPKAYVPWGEWNNEGYWWPNRILEMTAKEQHDSNARSGIRMMLTPDIQREIFGDNFMQKLPHRPSGYPQ
jgi:hypothetical protein